ncbi:hypothetical protein [Agarivorans sp. 3_MG-2023]|uniref:hypothetical protein n=1 Tax=Agarivorans sp. 3_MG-2023 TaxID=3062648 RepID=UPI0026E40442|nr:hypothetical protein [Agarivorans sp. 3_MG-2023]MDO6686137.1 hypothetical protein [Agarivorans sp. 3_MG-2023]MDO6716414.1 hypothetical protein [Agarivorans sp. 2_MG-2023]
MRSFGIKAKQVSPIVNHRGRRAPFFINGYEMLEGIKPYTQDLQVEMLSKLEGSVVNVIDKAG